MEQFADAKGIFAKYKRSARFDDSNLAALKVHADMDPVRQSLHEKMRKLCIKRQNGSTLRQKAKWALYEEKYFKKVIKDMQKLVDALPELFPAAKQE